MNHFASKIEKQPTRPQTPAVPPPPIIIEKIKAEDSIDYNQGNKEL